MEHPCHKCNQPVEDGVPFCSQCGAPQIRVQIPESVVATELTSATSFPERGQALRSPSLFRWSHTLRPCALAALLASVAISLGLTFPAAAIGGGFIAVALFRRRNPLALIKAGTGAVIGAISGIFAFAISGTFIGAAAAFTDLGPKLREQVLDAIQKAAVTRGNDPKIQAALDTVKTPEGFVVLMTFTVILFLVSFVLFASLGGAIGGVFLNRRR